MIEALPKKNIGLEYLQWHFFQAPKTILKAWRNFLVFNFNFFSISLLGKTLFSHWRRYREFYGKGFNLQRYFQVFVFNLFSRILGAIVRIFTILIGLIFEGFIFFLGVVVFLIWLFLPLIVVFLIFFGFQILIL